MSRDKVVVFALYLRFMLKLLRNSGQRRHVVQWIRSLEPDYFVRHKRPWIVFDAIGFLDRYDLAGKCVFEYGSGGSTLFWLNKGMTCVSVEHERLWYEKMRAFVPGSPYIDYRLVEPEPDNVAGARDPSDPDLYISREYQVKRVHYRTYVTQIDEFADCSFDVILIDGRARPSCIRHSITKLKPGGMLILDNADRTYYMEKTRHFLENYKCMSFFGAGPRNLAYWQTNIYFRRV